MSAQVAVTDDGGASDCLLDDDWHDTYAATGYDCCARCGEHHRHPELCDEPVVVGEVVGEDDRVDRGAWHDPRGHVWDARARAWRPVQDVVLTGDHL